MTVDNVVSIWTAMLLARPSSHDGHRLVDDTGWSLLLWDYSFQVLLYQANGCPIGRISACRLRIELIFLWDYGCSVIFHFTFHKCKMLSSASSSGGKIDANDNHMLGSYGR
ncbi:hypothetical protein OUZ56_021027 [Daphnia magna]|uniref:Uncharacterized protein n=1 Tax=Daphnia magna TaxID=35525 RepID=A0ABQ9ZHP1_9CRUS|nr:hypothetical protein OUZ56_021027 [Daphnia magna]